jgi:hypothetical protein
MALTSILANNSDNSSSRVPPLDTSADKHAMATPQGSADPSRSALPWFSRPYWWIVIILFFQTCETLHPYCCQIMHEKFFLGFCSYARRYIHMYTYA